MITETAKLPVPIRCGRNCVCGKTATKMHGRPKVSFTHWTNWVLSKSILPIRTANRWMRQAMSINRYLLPPNRTAHACPLPMSGLPPIWPTPAKQAAGRRPKRFSGCLKYAVSAMCLICGAPWRAIPNCKGR